MIWIDLDLWYLILFLILFLIEYVFWVFYFLILIEFDVVFDVVNVAGDGENSVSGVVSNCGAGEYVDFVIIGSSSVSANSASSSSKYCDGVYDWKSCTGN